MNDFHEPEGPRIVIAGGSALTRAGVRTLLAERGATILAAGSAVEPFERLLAEADLLVLLDADELAFLDAPDAQPPILLLGDEWPRHAPIERAWGVVPPDASADALWAAVGALIAGLCVLPPHLLRDRSQTRIQALADPGDEALTSRERDVLQLVAEGLTNRQIAARTGISEHTVKFHLSSIFSKLGAASRTEAIRLGARRGLVVW